MATQFTIDGVWNWPGISYFSTYGGTNGGLGTPVVWGGNTLDGTSQYIGSLNNQGVVLGAYGASVVFISPVQNFDVTASGINIATSTGPLILQGNVGSSYLDNVGMGIDAPDLSFARNTATSLNFGNVSLATVMLSAGFTFESSATASFEAQTQLILDSVDNTGTVSLGTVQAGTVGIGNTGCNLTITGAIPADIGGSVVVMWNAGTRQFYHA